MPMFFVRHETHLAYTDRISETVMEVRMTPREDAFQTLRGHRIDVGPTASVIGYDDWLENRAHQFSVLPYHDRVVILAQSAVEIDPSALSEIPEIVDSSANSPESLEFLRFSNLVHDDPRLTDLDKRLGIDGTTPWAERVERVMTGLCEHITYKRGVTTSATPLGHVLDEGAGVCQDLSQVALGLFRKAGISARYVSGYFWRATGPAELETHAWCDVYAPGIGWVGIDPTHKCMRGPGHIVVAIGRDYADVPPNRGVFRGSAKESIEVSVSIEQVDELPEVLKVPRVIPIDVPTYGESARHHEEGINYQQEQQQQLGPGTLSRVVTTQDHS